MRPYMARRRVGIPGIGTGEAAAIVVAAAASAPGSYWPAQGLLKGCPSRSARPAATIAFAAARSWLSWLLVLAACLAANPTQVYAWKDIWVTEYGAAEYRQKGDLPCTKAFQDAISDIAMAGGGILRVPAGVFFVGPFNLTSNMILWLSAGAKLFADTMRVRLPLLPALPSYGPAWGRPGYHDARAPTRADWRDAIPRYQPLVYGADLMNVTIAGHNGSIDGNGATWWRRWLQEPLYGRPHLVQFERSKGIRIENVTLKNPGFWCVHIYRSEYVEVRHLTILVPYEPLVRPTNTDGVNPDSSSHVLIEDSYLQTGDDSVAIKSGWDCYGRNLGVPSRNITIRRVIVRQTIGNNAAGVAIGSEMSAGVEDVLVEDCSFVHVGVAVEVKVGTVRGGYVRRVLARNLRVGASNRAALVVMATYPEQSPFCHDLHPPAPEVSDITYESVMVEGPTNGLLVHLQGAKEVLLRDVALKRVTAARGWGQWVCEQVTGTSADNSPRGCMALRDVSSSRYGSTTNRGNYPGSSSVSGVIASPRLSDIEMRKLKSQSYWRNDGRCGSAFPSENGLPARCPTRVQFLKEHALPWRAAAEIWLRDAPCCSKGGWCGGLDTHCLCDTCVDYRAVSPPAVAAVHTRIADLAMGSSGLAPATGVNISSKTYIRNGQQPRQVNHGGTRTDVAEPDPVVEQHEDTYGGLVAGQPDFVPQSQRTYSYAVGQRTHWKTMSPPDFTGSGVGRPGGAGIFLEPPMHTSLLIFSVGLSVFLCAVVSRRRLASKKRPGIVELLLCLASCFFFGLFSGVMDAKPVGHAAPNAYPGAQQEEDAIADITSLDDSLVSSSSGEVQGNQAVASVLDGMAGASQPEPTGAVSGGRGSSSSEQKQSPDASESWRGADRPDCARGTTVNPTDFGAAGSGSVDDSLAVLQALEYGARCGGHVIIGPRGKTFMVSPGQVSVSLHNVTVSFEGVLLGPTINRWNPSLDTWPRGSCAYGEAFCSRVGKRSPEFVRSQWSLLRFYNSSFVSVRGVQGGGLKAPGSTFWSIRNTRPQVRGYCLFKLEGSRRMEIDGLELVDSPMYQLVVLGSHGVTLSNLKLKIGSAELGDLGPHNTDGVSIIASTSVHLRDTFISSGDDNVVIKEGSRDVLAERLTLLRGKGISIGSLGERGASGQAVADVRFRAVLMDSCMHGARIKTWMGGHGLVQNVTFEDFKLRRVAYGILIDQSYCPLSQRPEGCASEAAATHAVDIKDVLFKSFTGTYVVESQRVICLRCNNVRYEEIRMRSSTYSPYASQAFPVGGYVVR